MFTMTVIERNFFRLLRVGTLGEAAKVEPMSVYKWKQLLLLAQSQGVDFWINKGITLAALDGASIPDTIIETAKTSERESHPSQASTPPMLNDKLLNKRLKKLRHQERHAIDTSIETLHILDIIIDNVNNMLDQDVFMNGIVQLGHYLRVKGDRVDFVKLESWLHKLHLSKIAQLQGSMLIEALGFSQDETPFVHGFEHSASSIILHSLRQTSHRQAVEWHFRQSKSGLLRNNTSALLQSIRRKSKYFPYASMETVGNFINNFVKSLSEIAE